MLHRIAAALVLCGMVVVPPQAGAAACPQLPDAAFDADDPALDLLGVSLSEDAGATVVTVRVDEPPVAPPEPPHTGRDYVVQLLVGARRSLSVQVTRTALGDDFRLFAYAHSDEPVTSTVAPAFLVGVPLDGEVREGKDLVIRVRLPRGVVAELVTGSRVTRIEASTWTAISAGDAGLGVAEDDAPARRISYAIGARGCP